ncbi:MAG: YbaK/EbsC family protein [Thermoplasmata archaeon]
MDPRAARVQEALRRLGVDSRVHEFDRPTRTSAQAADAVGVPVGRIVKSLVFRGSDGVPLLVLAAGDRRVVLAKVELVSGRTVRLAPPEWVAARTGFPVGGVPPVAHDPPMEVLMDETLLPHAEVWAAGGHPQAVFPIAPRRLAEVTSARLADITDPISPDGPASERTWPPAGGPPAGRGPYDGREAPRD